MFKGILMFGNFKAQKAPTENNIFCPSSEKVRSCREKNQFMSAIAEWWIYIMRSVLLICFTDSQLNNEESPLFFHYLKWTSWTSYYRKSEVSGGLPCFTTKQIIIPNCFNRCWDLNKNRRYTSLDIFRLICKWLEIQKFGVTILGRIHLILKHRFDMVGPSLFFYREHSSWMWSDLSSPPPLFLFFGCL